MVSANLDFPHLAASASLSAGFGSKTDITSTSFVDVGNATKVTVKGSAGTIQPARVDFMVLTRSSTAPDLTVQVKWGPNPGTSLTLAKTGTVKDKNNNDTAHYCYRATLDVSGASALTSDVTFVAQWKVNTANTTVSIYNATLSVVATDWGDNILPG